MSITIILILIQIASSDTGCIVTMCNRWTKENNICYKNRTQSGVFYVDFYSKIIDNIAVWCPQTSTTYCNDFIGFVDLGDTAPCSPLKATGEECISPYQCAAGFCVLGKCAGTQKMPGYACYTNSDCTYGYSCIGQICTTPLQLNASCSHATLLDFYGFEMDHNECDYTKNLICGYAASLTHYICMKLFSVTTNTYVSNPLLCSSMTTVNGWMIGNCIVNRTLEMYSLKSFDIGKNYKTCSSDSDCVYSKGLYNTTFNGSCNCAMFDANALKYCNFGGGEAIISSNVEYYKAHWITQFNTIYNSHGIKYIYALDNYLRNQFNNPAYCSIAAFYNNMTMEMPNTSHQLMFYIIVGLIAAIGLGGVIVVYFLM